MKKAIILFLLSFNLFIYGFSKVNTHRLKKCFFAPPNYSPSWVWSGAGIDNLISNFKLDNNIVKLQEAIWKADLFLHFRFDISQKTDALGQIPIGWVYYGDGLPEIAEPGANACAMNGIAELINLIYSNNELQAIKVNHEFYNTSIEERLPDGYNNLNKHYFFKDLTFIQVAELLGNYIDETLSYFEINYWEDHTYQDVFNEYFAPAHVPIPQSNGNLKMGFYRFWNNDIYVYKGEDWRGKACPYNYQTRFGEVMLNMYLARGNSNYLDKVERIANLYKTTNIGRGDYKILYEFSYDNKERIEDDHMAYIAKFLYLCYKNGIVINESDMDYMGQVFFNTYYNGPNQINHTDENASKEGISHYYLYFSNFKNKELYTAISEVLNGNAAYKILALHQQFHKLIYKDKYSELNNNSQIAGISSGDIDGDGREESVIVQNRDGDFFVYDHNASSIFKTFTGYGSDSKWADVTVGDFDGDGIDEIAAARNFNNGSSICIITVLKLNQSNGKLEVLHQRNAPYNDINWAGLAAGDFDDDGIDEIFALANSSNNTHCGFYMFELNGNNHIIEKYSARNLGWGGDTPWCSATSGDLNGDGKDEFIVIRNYDKIFRVYNLNNNGNCIGFASLSSGDINGWSDITTGDIDGDCKDELIAVSGCGSSVLKDDVGDIYIASYKEGQLKFTEKEYFRCEEQINAITCGDVLNGTNDEIIYSRNFDSNIITYQYTQPKNIRIDDDYILPSDLDGGSKDYYSQNSIIANSFFSVENGSVVNFTAGSKINLLPGFDAKLGSIFNGKIDQRYLPENVNNSLCKTIKIVKAKKDTNEKEELIIEKDFGNISIFPNPNQGWFNVEIEDDISNYKAVEILDLLGKVYYQKPIISNLTNIKINNLAKGNYIVRIVKSDKAINRIIVVQ